MVRSHSRAGFTGAGDGSRFRAPPIVRPPENADSKGALKLVKLFISYRRSDDPYATDQLCDFLVEEFGQDSVFKDVESIPLGMDFRRAIDEAVVKCKIALVVIGQHWLSAADKSGKRRLDDPEDFVRLEIESALRRKIPVIPVLLDGGELTGDMNLPVSIRPLVYMQGIRISRTPHFRGDCERLIRGIRRLLAGHDLPPEPRPSGTDVIAAHGLSTGTATQWSPRVADRIGPSEPDQPPARTPVTRPAVATSEQPRPLALADVTSEVSTFLESGGPWAKASREIIRQMEGHLSSLLGCAREVLQREMSKHLGGPEPVTTSSGIFYMYYKEYEQRLDRISGEVDLYHRCALLRFREERLVALALAWIVGQADKPSQNGMTNDVSISFCDPVLFVGEGPIGESIGIRIGTVYP